MFSFITNSPRGLSVFLLCAVLGYPVGFGTNPLAAQPPTGTANIINTDLAQHHSNVRHSNLLAVQEQDPASSPKSQDDQKRRIQSIQKRIQQLQQMVKEKQTPKPDSADASQGAGPTVTPPGIQNSADRIVDPPESDPNTNSAAAALENSADANDSNDATQTTPFPEELSVPVDSVELANSLFLSGNWKQAIEHYKNYRQAEPQTFAQDPWAQCMLAHCYRILGETGNAESLYRQSAANAEQVYTSESSKWYLTYLSKRKQMDTDFADLSAQADVITSEQKGN